MSLKAGRRASRRLNPALKPVPKPPLIAVARLEGLFGVHGELKCRPSSAGEGVIAAGRRFALDERGESEVTLASVRRHHGRFVITLEGVADADAALRFAGAYLYAARETLSLAPDEFLDGDLAGLRLIDEKGAVLGSVVRVEHYPGSDCLVVTPKGALVPMVREFVLKVDLEQRTISVRLPPGLLDEGLAEEA